MKYIFYIFSFFLLTGCTMSPEPNFVYYKSLEPASCNLTIGLSTEDSKSKYKVSLDDRNISGNFVKNGQQIIFTGLYASKSFGNTKMEVSALIKGDTLTIQNYGNAMNPFTFFSECDNNKYLSLVKVNK